MSFAVIKTGGKQYKVSAGEILKVELLKDSKPDSKIEFKEVLAYGDEKFFELPTGILCHFCWTKRISDPWGAKVESLSTVILKSGLLPCKFATFSWPIT